ncbi:MAG TPA: hypothetical protein VGE07_19510 [Herpetosiphonaceae bacterium]
MEDTGWPAGWIYGCLSLSILLSGALAPFVGRWIHRTGGATLVRSSGMLIGLGLMVLALAPALPIFVGGWGIIGIGMACGLYDALFATLARQYGASARRIIVQITLIAGLCTTVTWPLLSALIQLVGWRLTCGLYGLVLWLTIWPLTAVGLARPRPDDGPPPPASAPAPGPPPPMDRVLYRLLAVHWTLGASMMTVMSVQLLPILQAKGIAVAAALGVSALVGPCQIGIRGLEALRPPHHPIGSAVGSAALTAAGCGLLLGHPALAVGGVVCYSLGNGLRTILRGTLPLALFGAQRYPIVLGSLAAPALTAQAATPLATAYLTQRFGVGAVLAGLMVGSLLNLAVTLAMQARLRQVAPATSNG